VVLKSQSHPRPSGQICALAAPSSRRQPPAAALADAAPQWRQGQRIRAELLQLPEASGPCTGEVDGLGVPIHLLVFGESTAASVGAPDHTVGLAGCTARALAEYTGRPVRWRAHGQSGVTVRAARRGLLPTLPKASYHLAVVAMGVNDVVQLHSPVQWHRDLGQLLADLRARTDHPPVFLAGVPPLGQFPAWPEPLSTVLHWRGQLLDQAGRNLAGATQTVTHVPVPVPGGEDAFSADGVHPSPSGYATWGTRLGRAAAKQLRRRAR